MRSIKKVILHCSDSEFGNAAQINEWHRQRGFEKIGYHYIILNGSENKGEYVLSRDGVIEKGRPDEEAGAHCEGQNHDSIGICLIGKHHFSAKQLYEALPKLFRELLIKYGIVAGQVYGHYAFNSQKTCPNMDMQLLKDAIRRLG